MNIKNTGLNALSTPQISVEAKEELFLGALVHIDKATGKAELADKTNKPAVGVVTRGDFAEAGAEYQDEYTGAKRINRKELPIERYAILSDKEEIHGVQRANVEIGQAVYLDVAGKFTETKAGAGMKVGYVVDNINALSICIALDGWEK